MSSHERKMKRRMRWAESPWTVLRYSCRRSTIKRLKTVAAFFKVDKDNLLETIVEQGLEQAEKEMQTQLAEKQIVTLAPGSILGQLQAEADRTLERDRKIKTGGK